MIHPPSTITVPVDLSNPGQFFACCGLLELADRLWPESEPHGWFEQRHFCLVTVERGRTLSELLRQTKSLQFEVGDESDSADADNKDGSSVEAIDLRWNDGRFVMRLDWWSDKSIKPWAGSMKERVILRAMLDAIEPSKGDPFNDLRRVQYQSARLGKNGKPKKPQKKEPFYFDPRRGNKSHPLDCGFSPDMHKMEANCCPALEALCFIGLQRARPARTDVANHSQYAAWPRLDKERPGLPAILAGAVSSGMIRFPGCTDYVFDNYFRTDQRKHKTFSIAQRERCHHG